ncbi:hypothetical protein QWZ13_05625 [Reinekea marina]|uniref:DUF805 domain-containing protein n=1 Tax=Reinekea marina TaxID=1310421 RepID=A0ABV7WLT3_9GAMM|nr:hypothetical protein [Reinekea marina]MDN3648385.1 hypothetical protein [Reinekea marina]
MWNYIKLHWQGDRTQGTAFWINVVLLLVFVKFSIAILSITNIIQDQVVSTRLGLLLITLTVALVLPWSFIGSFRSTWKHIRLFRDRTTGGWLMVLLVLTLLYCAHQIKGYWPGLTNMVHIAMKQDTESFSSISGNERLLVSGYLTYGSSSTIIDQLNNNGSLKTVEFNLEGGHLHEARKLSRYLAINKYNTHIEQRCAENCLIAYLGGEKRTASESADISFHHYRGYDNGYRSDWTITREQNADRKYFKRRGVLEKATFILYYKQTDDKAQSFSIPTLKTYNIVNN